MKNKFTDITNRFLGGFAFATLIGVLISLLISATEGNGSYIPVMPLLAERFSTELTAVFVQFLLIGMIGVTFAEGALIFHIARWSFPLQCIVHFLITAVIYVPFAWLCWSPLKTGGIIIMVVNILFTYSLSWVIQYRINLKNIEQINQKLKEVRNVGN